MTTTNTFNLSALKTLAFLFLTSLLLFSCKKNNEELKIFGKKILEGFLKSDEKLAKAIIESEEIKEVNRHEVVLKYKAGSVFSKAKIWLFSSKVDEMIGKINSPMLQFDKINSEILIDLRNVDKLKEVLNILSISEIYLANNSINIGLKVC